MEKLVLYVPLYADGKTFYLAKKKLRMRMIIYKNIAVYFKHLIFRKWYHCHSKITYLNVTVSLTLE